MTMYQKFTQNIFLRRLSVLGVIILTLILLRGMMSLLLLTFIFTYLASQLVSKVRSRLNLSSTILVGGLYFLIVAAILVIILKSVPVISKQSLQLYNSLETFYTQQSQGDESTKNIIFKYISKGLPYLKSQSTHLLSSVTSLIGMIVTLFMSFVLSFFFMIEGDKVSQFATLFLKGKSAWFFQDIQFLGGKFTKTFGVVIEAQVIIACINTLLTGTALYIMHFPHLLSLMLMVFLFSFIPIAGVVISCIPLSLLAYSNGGIKDVVYILLTVMAVHLLESYVFNPKLMASRTKLPIFCTFLILVISNYFFHVWGLVLGIPVFMFILDLIGVKPVNIKEQKKSKGTPLD